MRIHRKSVRTLLTVLAVLTLLGAFFGGLYTWEQSQDVVEVAEEETDLYGLEDKATLYYDGVWYEQRENLETVLLLGLDKYETDIPEDADTYLNYQQADFCLLLLLDRENESFQVLHINRDTMTEISIFGVGNKVVRTETAQLALAHTYGSGGQDSCENTVEAVSGLLYGTNIDHYISLTMDAVAEVNDRLGGVTVEVMDDFSAVDPTIRQGEAVTLSGSQALTYVRARGSMEDSSNLRRMERQRQYLRALFLQAKESVENGEEFLLDTIVNIAPYMVSDCTAEELLELTDCVLQYDGGDIQTIEGEAVKGEEFMEFYPDEDALKQQVLSLCYVPSEE